MSAGIRTRGSVELLVVCQRLRPGQMKADPVGQHGSSRMTPAMSIDGPSKPASVVSG
jgi:hypothetical protein